MGVFEELAKLRAETVEQASNEIEIAARVIAEPGERLRRRGELLEEAALQMFYVAEALDKYGRQMTQGASKAERDEASDQIDAQLYDMGGSIQDIAQQMVDDVEDEQRERRAHEDAEALERELRR